MKRYVLWSLNRKHHMLWSFWIPLTALFALAGLVAFIVDRLGWLG